MIDRMQGRRGGSHAPFRTQKTLAEKSWRLLVSAPTDPWKGGKTATTLIRRLGVLVEMSIVTVGEGIGYRPEWTAPMGSVWFQSL